MKCVFTTDELSWSGGQNMSLLRPKCVRLGALNSLLIAYTCTYSTIPKILRRLRKIER